MGKYKTSGVDGAIAALLAVGRANGEITVKTLRDLTDIPRASTHRINTSLAQAGLLSLARGKLMPGPKCENFAAERAKDFTKNCQNRFVGSLGPLSAQEGVRRATDKNPASKSPQRLWLSKPFSIARRKRLKIGFSNASLSNPWRTALVHALEFGAAQLSNKIDWLAVRHADDSARVQCQQIDELVQAGVDGLVVSPTNSPAVRRTLDEASRSGVAIVLVDRALELNPAPISFVGSSDAVIGRTTALWLAEYLEGRGRIIVLAGRDDAEPARVRLAAAL